MLAGLGLGANLGDRKAQIHGALAALRETSHIQVVAVSALYASLPLGPPQPDYLNACALLETDLTPEALLHRLQAIELAFGRTRELHWGPRTLDLDLLFYEDHVCSSPMLTLPHPALLERNFVLIPLASLAPTWVHPIAQTSLDYLAQQMSQQGLRRLED